MTMRIRMSWDDNGINVSFGDEIKRPRRVEKGKSKIAFPDSYILVDTETTGLSPEWDSLIEIGAIKYCKGIEVDRFQSLIQPPFGPEIDPFITNLTGITPEMLMDAPGTKEVLEQFDKFVKDEIIVGYNVNFDINFLYDNYMEYLDKPFTNDYIDVMRIARKVYPQLPHHRLIDMVIKYGIDQDCAHRSIADVLTTQECYVRLYEDALKLYGSDEGFIKTFSSLSRKSIKAGDIVGDEEKVNPDSPLYGKHCVFTGKLERFSRKEAMQLVADLGGINEDGVTKSTNFLILGNNDYCATIKDGKSSKHKKAETLKLKGQDIEIVPETVFYDMLTGC